MGVHPLHPDPAPAPLPSMYLQLRRYIVQLQYDSLQPPTLAFYPFVIIHIEFYCQLGILYQSGRALIFSARMMLIAIRKSIRP
ncbi:hypothetical protein AOQ84DRAFT_92391 [Glonium stellatum]|uniref:Uncharacterized protein n=1 Tax=Glonium stellatum TaxID=574774 RepID=A0A8E2JZZ8_9PEZI|nr:hypothetical protein AOQ84DRAFT_92391 [Glonium stellatum]